MIRKRNIVWVAMILMGGFTISCMPDEDPCTDNFTGALTTVEEEFVGSWVLTGIEAEDEIDLTDDNTYNPSTDLYSQYGECETTAVYTFRADRNYSFEQGTADAECTSAIDIAGSWRLNGSTIELTHACSVYILYPVLAEDDETFTVSARVQIADHNNMLVQTKVTYTYSRM